MVKSLYFHIPFCNRKCPYCHFYVIPNSERHKEQLLTSLLQEWELIKEKLQDSPITSIYFGGGTPTLFGPEPIFQLIDLVKHKTSDCEITIEANPEDVTVELMTAYKKAGINRVSIGVQSLDNTSLQVLERTHDAQKALDAIWITHDIGIENISIDLMYELPNQTLESFQRTLEAIKPLPITHLSLYNLTIEPHTAFFKRSLKLPSDDEGLLMLSSAIQALENRGLNRYEISAFAKNGYESRHNLGYWTARPFWGLGPSAFSYMDKTRSRNIANINRYTKALNEGSLPIDFTETLPYPQNVHELLAVNLRVLEGVDLNHFDLPPTTHDKIQTLIDQGYLEKSPRLKLTEKGALFYDHVATELI